MSTKSENTLELSVEVVRGVPVVDGIGMIAEKGKF